MFPRNEDGILEALSGLAGEDADLRRSLWDLFLHAMPNENRLYGIPASKTLFLGDSAVSIYAAHSRWRRDVDWVACDGGDIFCRGVDIVSVATVAVQRWKTLPVLDNAT